METGIKTKTPEGPKYEDCFVAFLDILGFKNMINGDGTSDAGDILNILNSMTKNNELQQSIEQELIKNAESKKRIGLVEKYVDAFDDIEFYIMSDSVAVSVNSKYPDALYTLIYVCRHLQCKLYKFINKFNKREPVLLRGSIEKGDYYRKNRIAFGKAMVDAYVAQERSSRYPRIIVRGDLAENFLSDKQRKALLNKNKTDEYYYIDPNYASNHAK